MPGTVPETQPVPNWQAEFGASYQVPAAFTNEPDLFDISWHNDVSPSFCWDEDIDLPRLWVAHPDRDHREAPDMKRFCITKGDDVVWQSDDSADVDVALVEFRKHKNA